MDERAGRQRAARVAGLAETLLDGTLEQAFETLLGRLEGYGFESSIFTHMPAEAGGVPVGPIRMVDNFNSEWMRRYVSLDYLKCDPAVLLMLERRRPIVWHDPSWRQELPNEQERVVVEASDFGYAVGVSIPILDGNGRRSLLSLTSRTTTTEFDKRFAERGAEVATVLTCLHLLACREAPPGATLSDAEAITNRTVAMNRLGLLHRI